MFTRVCLTLALLSAVPGWSQATKNVTEGNTDTAHEPSADELPVAAKPRLVKKIAMPYEIPMLLPAPLIFTPYPPTILSESRSDYLRNYVRVSETITTAYSDNVPTSAEDTKEVDDIIYSIQPAIALDRTSSRLHWILNYRPGFTFYQRTGDLNNQQDQNLGMDFQYRLSPHITATLRDNFEKTSNGLNQPDLSSGTPQPSPITVVAPVADRLRNMADAELTYQFLRDSMMGAKGTFTNLNYPNPSQVPGLSEFSSRGWRAFYNKRLSGKHYFGTIYDYSQFLTYQAVPQNESKTHTASLFYTFYAKPTLSFSLSGGAQHVDVVQSPSPAYSSWWPAATASMEWQGHDTHIVARYVRTVSGVEGLFGAFDSNSATLLTSWRLTRSWNVEAGGAYAINKNVTAFLPLAGPGGHTISGRVSLQHSFTQHFNAELGYTHLHQSYSGIPAISQTPDTGRVFCSVTYQFARPL